MSKRLVFIAGLIWACSRNDRTSSAPPPARLEPSANGSSAAAATVAPPAPADSAAGTPSAAHTTQAGSILSVAASGYTSGLTLESDTVSYCDKRGGRAWAPAAGTESDRKRSCPSAKLQERNGTCEGIEFVTEVREPGPDDIIDVKEGPSLPVSGHIHDCAFSSGVLLVATGIEVVAIDVKTGRRDVKGKEGGNQVAINSAWIAWSDGEKVFAQRR